MTYFPLHLPRDPKILIRPLLRLRPPRFPRLRDGFPCLEFPAEHHVAETVAEEVAFGFELPERVAEFVGQDQF